MSYDIPQRLFLDTNIYIVGVANENSYERKILEAVGFLQPSSVKIMFQKSYYIKSYEYLNVYTIKIGVVKL